MQIVNFLIMVYIGLALAVATLMGCMFYDRAVQDVEYQEFGPSGRAAACVAMATGALVIGASWPLWLIWVERERMKGN